MLVRGDSAIVDHRLSQNHRPSQRFKDSHEYGHKLGHKLCHRLRHSLMRMLSNMLFISHMHKHSIKLMHSQQLTCSQSIMLGDQIYTKHSI